MLSVTATGTSPTYQWYRGASGDVSSPVPGATGPLLVSQPLYQSSSFWVRIEDGSGSTDSSAAAVAVNAPISGVLKGAGFNYASQLGGRNGFRIIPLPIAGDVIGMSGNGDAYSSFHTLFIKSDGSAWSLGSNPNGQLGIGDKTNRTSPVQAMTGVCQVAAGAEHSIFLKADGSAWGSGYNYYGQLGLGTSESHATPQPLMTDVAEVAAGQAHSHFLKRDGTLWSTGANGEGQLGDGTVTLRRSPVQVATGVAKVRSTWQHCLFLKTDGSLWGMGNESDEQLGTGSPYHYRAVPTLVATGVTDCETGYHHSLFRKSDGTWWAMGSNEYGQLGTAGGPQDIQSPASIGTGIRKAAAGEYFSLWLRDDGYLWAAGENQGAFGDGTLDSTTSTQLPRKTTNRPHKISAAGACTLFIDAAPVITEAPIDQAVLPGQAATFTVQAGVPAALTYQWYSGESGDTSSSLGTGTTFTTPALVADTPYWVRLINDQGFTDSSTVWGRIATTPSIQSNPAPASVRAGDGSILSVGASGGALSYQWYAGSPGDTSSPVPSATGPILVVPPLFESRTFWVRAINIAGTVDSAPATVTVSPLPAAVLRGAGKNSSNPLGGNAASSRPSPEPVASSVIGFDGSVSHTLYLKPDHTLWGVGNVLGGLKKIAAGVIALQGGHQHSLFLKEDFTLWGVNGNTDGQLGDGTTQNRAEPVQIDSGVSRIAAGRGHTLFVKTDGSLWASGRNITGVFGNGSLEDSLTPVFVTDGVVDVATGTTHTHFLKADGTLWATGGNTTYELGNSSYGGTNPVPVQVASGVSRISAGDSHTLFLKVDGTLWTTGNYLPSANPALPRQIASDVVRMSAGGDHSLFIKSDGSLWGLGANNYGELALGTTSTTKVISPVLIANGVLDVSAGEDYSLFSDRKPAIITHPASVLVLSGSTSELSVAAEGEGPLGYQWFQGESGDTNQPLSGEIGPSYTTPSVTGEIRFWVRVSNPYGTWNSKTAVVTPVVAPVITTQPTAQSAPNGGNAVLTVVAEGAGMTYQWFLGQAGDTSSPVSGATGPLLITPPLRGPTIYWVRTTNLAGSTDSVAVTITAPATIPSVLRATGSDTSGQLGNGDPLTAIASFSDVAQRVLEFSAGGSHSLFVTDDGTLWSMGSNTYGELGDGTRVNRSSPIRVAESVMNAYAGTNRSYYLKEDGSLWEFAYTNSSSAISAPNRITTGVAQASARGNILTFVKTDGTLWRLGGPYSIPGGFQSPLWIDNGVKRCASGANHYLYIKTDGSVWGSGENYYGQLGQSTQTIFTLPVQMKIGNTALTAVDLAAGNTHSLLLDSSGTVLGTGQNNFGQLGTTTPTSRSVWTVIQAPAISAIAAGGEHSFLLRSTGVLLACGRNNSGQLGTGSYSQGPPVQVASSVTRMSGGGQHSLIGVGRPLIKSQSLTVGAIEGQTPQLFVEATGFPNLSYRWYRGVSGDTSGLIADAISSTYTIPPFTGATNYWVRVTNAAGNISSQTISVFALSAPAFSAQPQSATTAAGLTATLTAEANGGELSYQWYRGTPGDTSDPVPGGSSSTLETPPLSSSASFWVRASNALGSTDSQAVTVTVVPGRMFSWGDGSHGQLGDGTITEHPAPLQIATGGAFVVGGDSRTLLVKTDGSLWGAGSDSFDTLGIPSGSNFTTFTRIDSEVASVGTGSIYSMYLKTDGTLWCMGNFSWEVKGSTSSQVPVQIASGVVKFAAGARHFFYLDSSGTLRGAGANFWGQLGDGSRTDRDEPVVIATDVKDVAAGDNYSLFLKQDGALWGMGWNASGQIGNETDESDEGTPVPVAGGVAKIFCGDSHSFFIKTDGSLWGMGANGYGQLGTNSTTSQTVPIQIDTHVAFAAAGSRHSLYLKTDGTLLAMGRNSGGQLGNGGYEHTTVPFVLAEGVTHAAADSEASYFIKSDGSVWAAGANGNGEFGNGVVSGHYSPVIIEQDAVAKVAVAYNHSFFIKSNGELFATGRNSDGQLGDGTIQTRFQPVSIATNVSDVFTSTSHTLIIKMDGTLWATGENDYGQLGDGTTGSRRSPVFVDDHVINAAAGGNFSLFQKADGSLWGMGSSSSGQLGTSSYQVTTPIFIASSVKRFAAGASHTLFIKKDGTLWAMGDNSEGQAIGAQSYETPLHQVASGVVDVAACGNHTLYVTEDGKLWVVGSNRSNQISRDHAGFSNVPEPVQLAQDVSRVWTGDSASLFLKTDGSLWSQGYGNDWNTDGYKSWMLGIRPVKLATGIVSAATTGGHSLFVSIGPMISNPPDNKTIPAGGSATFTVTALGNGPISYQWFRGFAGDTTQPLAGATSPEFTTPPSSSPAAYWVRVSNEYGHHDSKTALLAIEGLGGNLYQEWAVENGLSDLAQNADPDHDGLSNLVEHFLNSDPMAYEAALRPTGAFVAGETPAQTITFRASRLAGFYQVDWSPDLTTWNRVSNVYYPHVINDDVDGDGQTYLLRLTRPIQPGEAAGFLRVTVPEE